jgi:formylglycine-generating enzyme required for sulfatase activity
MKSFLAAVLCFTMIVPVMAADGPLLESGESVKAGNGAVILDPTSKKTNTVKDADRTVQVPEMMVYIPAGKARIGAGDETVVLDGFCIGKFSVTNAEYRAFLIATGSTRFPRYWTNGAYPQGKANHPVVYVSLTDAESYAKWVSDKTGWNIVIPTSNQWEKAARGPNGSLYPWGDTMDVSYQSGILKSRFSFNGVTVAEFLKNAPKKVVKYDNPKSPYFGKTTTVDRIAAYNRDGQPTFLTIGPNGSVRGWVNHDTYTGFIYTDLFTSLNDAGGNTAPVGSYEDGKSGYGCYDMAGNVWNWCETLILATNGAERGKRVNEIRGGSWYANGTSCKCVAIGEGRAASGAYNTVGFRIAMIPASTK